MRKAQVDFTEYVFGVFAIGMYQLKIVKFCGLIILYCILFSV